MATRHSCDVVVIGARLSGLYAARLTVSAIANGDRIGCSLLRCMSPEVALSGRAGSPKAAPYAHFYYQSAIAAAEKSGVRVEMIPVT